MRQIIFFVGLLLLGWVATQLLRHMTARASDRFWRGLAFAWILLALFLAGISEAFYPMLRSPQHYPIVSTAFVAAAAAILVGGAWWLYHFGLGAPAAATPIASEPQAAPATALEPSDATPLAEQLSEIEDDEYRQLVAETILIFDPNADLQVDGKKAGADGGQRIDLAVRAVIDGKLALTLIDVFDSPSGNPIGVDDLDSIDTRRRDLGAANAIVFSNTGFDQSAKSKAQRTDIRLLSVVRSGDTRARAVIEQRFLLRRVYLDSPLLHYDAADTDSHEFLGSMAVTTPAPRFEGKSAINWIVFRAVMVVLDNPKVNDRIMANFNFKQPVQFDFGDRRVRLKAFGISFVPRTQWLEQAGQIDAKSAIYDHLRGRLRMAPGDNFAKQTVNFDTATPIDAPENPPGISMNALGFLPGEVSMMMAMGIDVPMEKDVPNAELDPLVRPDDLLTKIQVSPPQAQDEP